MALGTLSIIYGVLIIIAAIIQYLLYKGKNKTRNSIFIVNMLLGIFLSYIAFTSLPANFTVERILAVIFGIISPLAVVFSLINKRYIVVSKVMLTISIIGGFVQLFI